MPLDMAAHSFDLITASMLISQFESEPYAYFSRQAAAALGTPSAAEAKRLEGPMDTLRSDLLATQMERVCDEIERLLAPDGRCYVSFEMFHRGDGEPSWFLVDPMVDALGVLGERFRFDFDTVPEATASATFEGAKGRSIIHQYLLQAKD